MGVGVGFEGYVYKYALAVLFVRLNGMQDMLIILLECYIPLQCK